MEAGTT
jgi:hypothetical protein